MSIEVRSATPADIDRICDVVADALEPEDAAEARIVLEDPAFDRDRWLVGLVDGVIASTLAVFDGVLRIGETTMPAAQIEFVATDEAARGKGLIRAQMEEAHRRSAAAGHVAQVIVGIPHFYRQFGYSYALRQPGYQLVTPDVPIESAGGWEFRVAEPDDVPAVIAAQTAIQREATVALAHTPELWRWMIASPNYQVLVCEHKGSLAVGRIYEDGDTAYLGDVVAPAKGALHGLIAAARHVAPEVAVMRRADGLTTAMLDGLGEVDDDFGWYYVRIGDPARLLDALRPELTGRLAASPAAGYSGELMLSLYRRSFTTEFAEGVPGPFSEGVPVPYPVSAGGSGVPEDLLPDLVLGPDGAAELERRHGDVLLGTQRELIEVLFPPMTADVQTWVFP